MARIVVVAGFSARCQLTEGHRNMLTLTLFIDSCIFYDNFLVVVRMFRGRSTQE